MLINNIVLPEDNLIQLLKDIKKKKELQNLSDDFVREHLFQYLRKNLPLTRALQEKFHPRSAAYAEVVKHLRSQLRRVYGLFREAEELQRVKELLAKWEETSQGKKKELLKEILAKNPSTRERLPVYDQLYKKLFGLTGKPKVILDLGAGLHPFSIPFMPLRAPKYYAYDLDAEEISILQEFFSLVHKENSSFQGTAEVFDALHFEELAKLPQADVAFLLKMTDVFDRGKGHKVSEYVITAIPARFVVVSFPTVTMSGKNMNFPRRKWIELLSRRLGYKWKSFILGKEIFYVLEKGGKE